MKILLLLIASTLPLCAQLNLRDPGFIALLLRGEAGPPPPPAEIFFTENFEGTGYDDSNANGWTDTGTGDFPDYVGHALQGSHSLLLSNTPSTIAVMAPLGEFRPVIFAKLQFRVINQGTSPSVLAFTTNEVTQFSVRVQSDTLKLRVKNFGESLDSDGAVSIDTDYYMWVEFRTGNGFNGVSKVWVNTANDKASSPITVSITNGDAIAPPDELSAAAGNGGILVLDAIQLNTEEIP